MILLDTNVVSELMKDSPDPHFMAGLSGVDRSTFAASVITIDELVYGIERMPKGHRRSAIRQSFEDIIRLFQVVEIDSRVARISGAFRAKRAFAGRPVSLADALIAATASSRNFRLATRNIRDFDGMDLTLIDPWKP